jgi:hypothetical protein
MADPVLEALREGWISPGTSRLRLGTTIRDAECALGLDPEKPERRWREPGGAEGARWRVAGGLLWSPPGAGSVELVFLDDALQRVSGGGDASWESSGTSWADFDPAVEIRNYRKGRKDLEARLGKPDRVTETGESLLASTWLVGGMELTLCWESRTPSLSISLSRVMPETK